jgi:hypothetical protein
MSQLAGLIPLGVPGADGVWPAVAVVPPDSSGGQGASTKRSYLASV